MKRPNTIRGQATATGVQTASANHSLAFQRGVTKTGDYTYEVQGTAAKPYVIDLRAIDARFVDGDYTPKCTCTDWATKRNKLVSADALEEFHGYSCKHIKLVLEVASRGVDPATQRRTDEIIAKFKKGK